MRSQILGSAKYCRDSKSTTDSVDAPTSATSSETQVSTMSSEPPSSAMSSKFPDLARSSRAPVSATSPQPSSSAMSPQKHVSGTDSVVPSSSKSSKAAMVRYVCTVNQSCGKTFDNFHGWAQHECNAHRKLYDMWYCNGVDSCTNAFYKRADFSAHFQIKHPMGRNKMPRSSLSDDYFLGPKYGKRFWCGFCNMVIPTVIDGFTWGYQRLEHVKSHFNFECSDEIWYCDIYGWNFIQVVTEEPLSSQALTPPPVRPLPKCPQFDSLGGERSNS